MVAPGIKFGSGILIEAGVNLGSGTGPVPPEPTPGVDNQTGYLEMVPPVVAGNQLEDVTATVNNPYGFTINNDTATGVGISALSASNQVFFATYGTGTKTCTWGAGSTVPTSTINVIQNSGPTLIFYIQGQTGPATYNYPFIFGSPVGQETYAAAGTYSFIVPDGVTSICSLTIGGGGAGGPSASNGYISSGAGGAGGLSWKNNIAVTPGEALTVTVGAAGAGGFNYIGNAGGLSKIARGGTNLLLANGGGGGRGWNGLNPKGATYAGGAGGAGGTTVDASYGGGNGGKGGDGKTGDTYRAGGGGAGGYTGGGGGGGDGGASYFSGNAGSGGGGGGGSGTPNNPYSGGGGGVGIYGQGANGAAGAYTVAGTGVGGGGSGGANGYGICTGGAYGGGGAGSVGGLYGAGAIGAVRIIWGTGRNYPSTNTGNV
jgi:hypothetical protein